MRTRSESCRGRHASITAVCQHTASYDSWAAQYIIRPTIQRMQHLQAKHDAGSFFYFVQDR